MRLWLDDLRPPPPGWTWVTTAWDAITGLQAGGVIEISLDHDLGPPEAGTGYDVARWIEAEAFHGRLPRLRWGIHSANPIGVARMTVARGAASRRDLLVDLALEPPTLAGDLAGPPTLDDDWLVLSTIHSAKGLEWDAVTVIHAADGCIPSDLATGDPEQVEEERRLLYVALTRARRHLVVTAPLRFHVRERQPHDDHVHAPLTRFLPPSALARFDERVEAPWGAAPGAAPGRASSPGLADAVRARARTRWM
ncbi:MAG: ATP-binding domain-containing protein [Planctomycetes bacterium]|nr:ATP-binding domain-containing protein [Planctomycetota bacterium]